MDDQGIIDLFWKRSDQAISETQSKYGRMLCSVSYRILGSMEDAEECENDTYLKAWNAMPPSKPGVLSAFLARITRNLSLDRYDSMRAAKRGGGELPLLLDELSDCIPDAGLSVNEDPAEGISNKELTGKINHFLGKLNPDARVIFMRRYWFGDSVKEISERTGFGDSKIKMSLLRSRKELRAALEKEGYTV